MNRDTVCIHGGYTPENGEPRNIPIVQSTTFRYATGEAMGALFDLEASGYFYTRLQNPTNDRVAAKITQLEGGTAGMLTSSGQAANFYAVFNIASCGDHVVASSTIYGGTFNLFAVTMKRMGIDFTFVSPDCSDDELAAAFRPNTKAVSGRAWPTPRSPCWTLSALPRRPTTMACPSSSTTPFPPPSTAGPLSSARTS